MARPQRAQLRQVEFGERQNIDALAEADQYFRVADHAHISKNSEPDLMPKKRAVLLAIDAG